MVLYRQHCNQVDHGLELFLVRLNFLLPDCHFDATRRPRPNWPRQSRNRQQSQSCAPTAKLRQQQTKGQLQAALFYAHAAFLPFIP
jgi:hypothetical protein